MRGSDGRFQPRSLPGKRKAPGLDSGSGNAACRNAEGALAAQDRALRPSQCRPYLRRALANSFPAIVRGFVKQAESGSVQHLRLTTELMGEPGPQARRKGSAHLLLEKLDRMEPTGWAKPADGQAAEADDWLA